MKILSYILPGILLLAGACNRVPDTSITMFEYDSILAAWDHDRLERLKSEEGWLNLAGLFWLKEGNNRIGSDSTNDIIFPQGTYPHIGVYLVEKERIVFSVDPDARVNAGDPVINSIQVSPSEETVVLSSGTFRWFVIERDHRFAIRLRDLNHPNIHMLQHIERFPADPGWRIPARFIRYDIPDTLLIPTVLGTSEKALSYGRLEFRYRGKKYSLVPTGEPGKLFVVFADETSDIETYAAGRFLSPEPINNEWYLLDFNKAYNPPCAFTPFATCPLPRPENSLPLRITAGEKTVEGFH